MKNKKTLKTRLRNWAAGGLITVLGAIGTGCSTQQTPGLYLENTVATNSVYSSGSVIGRDPLKHTGANGSTAVIDFKNGLTAIACTNYNLADKELHELDAGVFYSFPITKKVSGKIGFWRWNYPSEFLGENDDNVSVASVSYKGAIDASFNYLHLFANEDVDRGELFNGKISKSLPVGKLGKTDVSLTPSVSTALGDNYYGSSGLFHVTPGASIGFNKGNTSLNIFVNHQLGMHGRSDLTYAGISIGKKF